jgi:hypothetical protein
MKRKHKVHKVMYLREETVTVLAKLQERYELSGLSAAADLAVRYAVDSPALDPNGKLKTLFQSPD